MFCYSHHAYFLNWTTHHQAKNSLFQFYILLVKNSQNQQKDIDLIVNFINSIHHTNIPKILKVSSCATSIDPELLDIKQLEHALILHLQKLESSLSKNNIYTQHDLIDFIKKLIHIIDHDQLHNFKKLHQHLIKNISLYDEHIINSLIDLEIKHGFTEGTLNQLIEHLKNQKAAYTSKHMVSLAKKTEHEHTRQKLVDISLMALSKLLQTPKAYHAQPNQEEPEPILYHIDMLFYSNNKSTMKILSRIIKNRKLPVYIRFEAVFIYFEKHRHHHPEKSKISKKFLSKNSQYRYRERDLTPKCFDDKLFQNTEFFNLNEILIAIQHQPRDLICRYIKLYHTPQHQDKIINALLTELNVEFNQTILNTSTLHHLCSALKQYQLTTKQQTELHNHLLHRIRRQPNIELVEMLYRFHGDVPSEHLQLLSIWSQLEYSWFQKGLDLSQIWHSLIDAEVLPTDAVFDPTQYVSFESVFLGNIKKLEHDRNSDYRFEQGMSPKSIHQLIEWLDPSDLENIPSSEITYFNDSNQENHCKIYFYFKYQNRHYGFFIYHSSRWSKNQSFTFMINHILTYFKLEQSIYFFEDDDPSHYYDGEHDVYFSAHRQKFKELNQQLCMPCIEPAFFTPTGQSTSFLTN